LISARFGQQVAAELSRFELSGAIRQVAIHLVGDPQALEWSAPSDVAATDPHPLTAFLSGEGELLDPRDYPDPPLPPSSFQDPSGRLEALAEAPDDVPPSGGSPDAAHLHNDPKANLDHMRRFELLGQQLDSMSPTGRVDALVKFAAGTQGAMTASGVPLANVALACALRETRNLTTDGIMPDNIQRGLSAAHGELARQIVFEPSVLIPEILTAQETWAATQDAPARQAVAKLREDWTTTERVRGLAKAYLRALGPDPIPPRHVWIQLAEKSWFAIPMGSRIDPVVAENDGPSAQTEATLHRVRFLPRALLVHVTALAVEGTVPDWPSYLGLNVRLGGQALLSSVRTGESPEDKPAADDQTVVERWTPLASATSVLTQADVPWGARMAGDAGAAGAGLETMLSQPTFEIVAVLVSPARLYAAARQRAFLFGGLILAAAGTSGLGLVYAGRAFQHQKRLAEMQSNFVSSVSHELRAPIASVRVLAEGLERGTVADAGRQAEYYRLIGQECRRLGSLIENVLDFASMDQRRNRYEFEPTDLGALVRHTIDTMGPYAADKQVRLVGEITPGELNDASDWHHAVVDGRAVQQALVNLIDNAIKHSPAAETVTVRLSSGKEPGRVVIEVRDHGPGIPVTERERIFEPFYRRGSELRRETTGIGIGLAIVKHVADAHGGSVRVWNESGGGSRFTLELPRQSPMKSK
jgi:two-component system phosphate regulon sensor histidine kinase PhoR